ncbi:MULTISPECIES: hypothetical protein [Paraburkholderia]|uniref:hypothetical protein n=1 Tax=Paraburkholderia TaxID=1822464 RepID=UPI001CB2EB6F|nr:MULTISPECIES: hypothetical protein [Paraburkholderia]CAG9194413.1 conserved hypothetical protein [Paraburkholderia caribensis]
MRLTPTDFPTVSDSELRELWRRHQDPDVRRLILEVHRARAIIRQAHADALDAQLAMWNKRDGDLKAQLQAVIDAMLAEKIRLGAMGGSLPKG